MIKDLYTSSGALGAGTVNGLNTSYSLSAGTTSTSQAVGTTGVYQVLLDLTSISTSDVYLLELYEKAHPNSAQVLMESWIYAFPIPKPLVMTPPLTLINGWDYRLYKLTGSTTTTLVTAFAVRQIS